MISIIICSRNTDISKSQQINLGETIGTAFEIICIDNSENKYSIFQAYNFGARQAKFPFLCFIHDDIIFQTANWGINLIQHFEDSEFGLIGVAGSQYKSKYLSGWGCSPKFMRVNLKEINLMKKHLVDFIAMIWIIRYKYIKNIKLGFVLTLI